jgi:hypothetical protein
VKLFQTGESEHVVSVARLEADEANGEPAGDEVGPPA